MRNKFTTLFVITITLLAGITMFLLVKQVYATCCGSPQCDASNNCNCTRDQLCPPGSCSAGQSCQWVATCAGGGTCCASCQGVGPEPTLTPVPGQPTEPPSCNDSLYPQCSSGSCGAGRECKKEDDADGGCKCLPVPVGSCTIQGFKQPSSNANVADQKIDLIDDGATGLTTNPYVYNTGSGSHQVTAEPLAGYRLGYTVCTNSSGCHGGSPVPTNFVEASSWTGNCPDGGWVDLWWHYISNATPTPTLPPCSAPGSISGVAQCSGTDSQIRWSWGAVSGATQYQLQTDRSNAFNTGYLRTYSGITTNSFTSINHAYSVPIYARVRVSAGNTCSPTGGNWRTIGSPVTTLDCDLTATPIGGGTDCAMPSNLRLTSQTCNANGNIDATWAWDSVSG